MRRLAVAMLLAALVSPASAGAQRWQPDVAGAAAWAAQRQGIGDLRGAHRATGLRGRGLDHQVPTASVLKAMLMIAYLRQSACATGRSTTAIAPCCGR